MQLTEKSGRRAVIVGGSMGGLFVSNMLLRRGWNVLVVERAEGTLGVRGAGIAGHPEYVPILRSCGIDAGRLVGVEVVGRTAYDRDGHIVGFHAHPQYLTYWGLLHAMLQAAFPAEKYHAGVGLVDVTPGEQSSRVLLSDGRVLEADLVVGADGIRSSVRAILAPEIQPVYAGYFAFRGITPEARLSAAFRSEMMPRYAWMFPGDGQLNGYPICGPDYAVAPGRRQYAYLWYRQVDAATMADLLTDASGRTHAETIPPPLIRQEHFANLRAHARSILPPLFAEMVTTASNEMLQPMYDVESRDIAFGTTCLVGDAAFTARPHIGVGILKAGQDALALAACLDTHARVADALKAYAAMRLPAGRQAVHFSRYLGSFIERGHPHPTTDPALELTPQFLLEASARSVESALPFAGGRRVLIGKA
jgi:2-polyprenyl-6-methoxyphenol hydroxylase-like FAD-dependent oxidoreductase